MTVVDLVVHDIRVRLPAKIRAGDRNDARAPGMANHVAFESGIDVALE